MPIPIVRVLVVDDFEAFRRFVVSTIREQPELQVICEASDGVEASSPGRIDELHESAQSTEQGCMNVSGSYLAVWILFLLAVARRRADHHPCREKAISL